MQNVGSRYTHLRDNAAGRSLFVNRRLAETVAPDDQGYALVLAADRPTRIILEANTEWRTPRHGCPSTKFDNLPVTPFAKQRQSAAAP